jgi:hypothetical protein
VKSYVEVNKATALLMDLAKHAWYMRVLDSIKYKPGAQISRLPEEQRELLRTLKSNDIKDIGGPATLRF